MEFVIGMITDKIAAPVTDLANPSFAVEEFFGGKIGMHVDGPWQFINIGENSDFEWDVAPMPAGPAGSVTWAAGSGFGISNTTENPAAAWTALKTITSTASLKTRRGRTWLPGPRVGGIDLREAPAAERRRRPEDTRQRHRRGQAFRDDHDLAGDDGDARARLQPVFLGKQSVDAVVRKVKPQFDKLLAENQEILEQQS